MGREAEPAGGFATRSRAVRASCLPALRPACEVRRWMWSSRRRSDPRPFDGLSHEAWPGSHQGTTHPLGRAVVERRKASCPLPFPPPQAGEGEGGGSAAPQSAEVTVLRLPAFHNPLFVVCRVGRAQRNPPWLDRKSMGFAALYPSYGETEKAKRRNRGRHRLAALFLPGFALHVTEIAKLGCEGASRDR